MYSQQVLEHFDSPRHLGPLPVYGGYARKTNPVCGDILEFWAHCDQGEVTVAFRASGCVPVLAIGSLVADYCQGRSMEEVRQIDRNFLGDLIGPLPRSKKHAISLAVRTLEETLRNLNESQH